jgi:hypothetical protein
MRSRARSLAEPVEADRRLHVFQRAEPEVGVTPGDLTATGGVNGIAQTQGNTTVDVRPVGIVPNAFQIAFFPDLPDLLNEGVATNLDNSGNGLGPADLSHAFQWNLALGPGQAITLAAVKELTTKASSNNN